MTTPAGSTQKLPNPALITIGTIGTGAGFALGWTVGDIGEFAKSAVGGFGAVAITAWAMLVAWKDQYEKVNSRVGLGAAAVVRLGVPVVVLAGAIIVWVKRWNSGVDNSLSPAEAGFVGVFAVLVAVGVVALVKRRATRVAAAASGPSRTLRACRTPDRVSPE